jgi:hypothetical protein
MAIQTSPQFRGVFRQGTTGTVVLRLSEVDGSVVDPESIAYTIVQDTGSVVIVPAGVPEKVREGIYVFDWDVPLDQTPGRYTVTWNYTYLGTPGTSVQSFVVSADATDTTLYSGTLVLMRESLELMVPACSSIPVYNQPARTSLDKRTYRFSKGNWNPFRGVTVYRNKEVVADGLTIDYNKGAVTFDMTLTDVDTVHADYNFRWFEDIQLDRFLSTSIHVFNSYPPQKPIYGLGTLPTQHYGAVLMGAAVGLIQALMFDINFREPAKYFDDPSEKGRSGRVFQQLEALKKNYEELWMKMLEQKKLRPYVGLTKQIVTPEYTLPGGRSRWFRYLFSGSAGAG